MKHPRTTFIAALVAAVAGAGLAEAGHIFLADLTGFDEVPAIFSTGSGELAMRIEPGDTSISFILSYTGLTSGVTAAHVHFGKPGDNGGIIAFLCGGGSKPPCPVSSGSVTSNITAVDIIGPQNQGIGAGELPKLMAAIRAGAVYANVHSNFWPGGEIRGQVVGP